ncbi:MAG TPA: histidine kinase [Opitutaceae bacterium]
MVTSASAIAEDTARRERRKARLYTLGQTLGWGGFLTLQIVFSRWFASPSSKRGPLETAALVTMVACSGLLLTHYARAFMTRWGWKNLGWLALLPRVMAMAAVLSVLWSAFGFGFTYGVLREPWPQRYSPHLLFVTSLVNGWSMLVGWLCIYFFYHLFDRFNRSETERWQLQSTLKETELRALRSQMNPHFMFNSLNSVRALIDEDPARARQAVTQLANLLRYALQSGHQETVPFEEELRIVNDYLALEQVRHEERLRVRIDVAPEALRQPLPPLLLQTLVENAVKYGISARPEGGEISITARCAGAALELRVTNPGELSGFAADHRAEKSTGLGLQNASNRLRLLFGEQASFALREEPRGTVVASVSVPLGQAGAVNPPDGERGRPVRISQIVGQRPALPGDAA